MNLKNTKNNFDTLLISRPENIRYLSGFSGEGLLLMKKDRKILITDSRYLLLAKKEAHKNCRVVLAEKSLPETFVATLKSLRTNRLGFEARHTTVAQLAALKKKTRQLKIKFLPTENVIEKQREVKSATEIRLIQKACQITVRVLKTVLRELKFGQTELEVAQKIAQLAARFGAEKLSFDSIVAFGENAACPHAKPGTRKLKHGDAALFDLGVVYRGYSSDMTRTFFTAPPTSKQKQIYEAVLAAQQAGLATIRSGVKAATVDAAVRKILKTAGYEKQFTHSTGHGVGLQIHEAPSLSPKSKEILKNNMIITCEPGVYLAEEFGVRIEDSVAVTRSGAKILTNFSKKLRVLKI